MSRIDDDCLVVQPGVSSLEVGFYMSAAKGGRPHLEVVVDSLPQHALIDVENEVADFEYDPAQADVAWSGWPEQTVARVRSSGWPR